MPSAARARAPRLRPHEHAASSARPRAACPVLYSLLSPYVRTPAKRDLLCCRTEPQRATIDRLPSAPAPLLLKMRGQRIAFVGDSSMGQVVEGLFFLYHQRGHEADVTMNVDFHLNASDAGGSGVGKDCVLTGAFRRRPGATRVGLRVGRECRVTQARPRQTQGCDPACGKRGCDQPFVLTTATNRFEFWRRDKFDACYQSAVAIAAASNRHVFATFGLHYNAPRDAEEYAEHVQAFLRTKPPNAHLASPFPQHFPTRDGAYEGQATCACVGLAADNWRARAARNASAVPLYDALQPLHALHKRTGPACYGDCTHYCFEAKFWRHVLRQFDGVLRAAS